MIEYNNEKHKLISLKILKKAIFVLIFIFVFDVFFSVNHVFASESETDLTALAQNELAEENFEFINGLPQNPDFQVIRTSSHRITAYNSEINQCWGNPCITANGFNLREHGIEDSIAANFLPFGAKVRIPELFGDKIFIVRDRMHERFSNSVDIWMLDKGEARQFGVKRAIIEILDQV